MPGDNDGTYLAPLEKFTAWRYNKHGTRNGVPKNRKGEFRLFPLLVQKRLPQFVLVAKQCYLEYGNHVLNWAHDTVQYT